MTREPLFLKFINKEIGAEDLLHAFSRSSDSVTREAAEQALKNPPDLEDFRKELIEAVSDIIKEGPGEEFKAFVNNYMESSLIEDVERRDFSLGENVSRSARIKDSDSPWVQGFLCYNVCLYIKAFGLEDLKRCKVCSKFFNHKGKYAVYCGDPCKTKQKSIEQSKK